MNRLYVVESMPSGTGAIADHRLPMRSRDVEPLARALAARILPTFVADAPAGHRAVARLRWRAIYALIAAPASWLPGRANRRLFMRWRMRSTIFSATSARPCPTRCL